MPRVEGEPGFFKEVRKKTGEVLVGGGLIAGGIGLLVSGQLVLVGVLAAVGGFAIKGSDGRG